MLDEIAAKRMRLTLDDAVKASNRLTVRELLDSAGIHSAYVHGRQRFPLCSALIEEFKKSPQSERQTGGREYWQQRTPSRWGLPSKRRPKSQEPACPAESAKVEGKG
jgi:hypothetical protein